MPYFFSQCRSFIWRQGVKGSSIDPVGNHDNPIGICPTPQKPPPRPLGGGDNYRIGIVVSIPKRWNPHQIQHQFLDDPPFRRRKHAGSIGIGGFEIVGHKHPQYRIGRGIWEWRRNLTEGTFGIGIEQSALGLPVAIEIGHFPMKQSQFGTLQHLKQLKLIDDGERVGNEAPTFDDNGMGRFGG